MNEKVDIRYLSKLLRRIPDFPKPGILFRDITPILADPKGLHMALEAMEEVVRQEPPDRIVAMESRGFLFGVALADRLGVGFAPIRKPGKLPWKTQSESYELEYGEDTLEIHADAVRGGEGIWIVDDLLATGGTAAAAARLVERLGGRVLGACFLIELEGLGGRQRLARIPRVAAVLTEEE